MSFYADSHEADQRFGATTLAPRTRGGVYVFECQECGYSTGARTDRGTVERNRRQHIMIHHDPEGRAVESIPALDAVKAQLDELRGLLDGKGVA